MRTYFPFSTSSLLIVMLLGAQSAAASLVLQNTTHYYICSRAYSSLICHFCTFPPFLVLGSVICRDASVHFCGPSGEELKTNQWEEENNLTSRLRFKWNLYTAYYHKGEVKTWLLTSANIVYRSSRPPQTETNKSTNDTSNVKDYKTWLRLW